VVCHYLWLRTHLELGTCCAKIYERLNVLLLVYSLEEVSKAFPLIPNKPLEASTTVKQGSVEIEDHGLNLH
jgi:hypothetical protein